MRTTRAGSRRPAETAVTSPDAVRLDAVSKEYGSPKQRVRALDAVTASFGRGTFTAVMGPSGSGKSTLLHCAAGLDRPTSGRVMLGDTELSGRSETELTELRRDRIGFVFQAYNLIGALSVADNVTLPVRLAERSVEPARLSEVLAAVGLAEFRDRRPSQLSGGQQQRVAIARALVTRPDLVCADEPTGALDSRSSRQVLALLRRIVDEFGQTVLMVTHDPVAAAQADRVLFLADGRLAGELHRPSAEQVAERMTHLGER
ncbi:ABC transporter ATP-binding protein [Dactylosporangium aurantiacum]|uniref:ABC transporter ATP-binding protein n=1 Tax=Dactylosporangium aurantiacum TaxID=35754 RepID=A0A9Q9MMM9_9ACTN|nr:ABC transporter ATP-binding protein [Dactylosporangium aurantiacum]MDG6110267.1 ABC transporter ATP-binding protein [Dactylosporangium aurantiacum]UWZ58361.1 ABC transporter ATP-binding protein [Dactylosporangium aurantiacum]